MIFQGWTATAFNQAPDSANEIHGDRVARQYGFRGGLVPGVTISACLIHPAVQAWEMDYLERGYAHVRVGSPLYDGEVFTVDITDAEDRSCKTRILGPDGTVSATAEIILPDTLPEAPVRRGDPVAEADYRGPDASFESLARLQTSGCHAFRYRWNSRHPMHTYVRDETLMPACFRSDHGGFANPAFLLGCSNWVLSGNAHMNPWVHLETRSQNFAPVPPETSVIAEMTVQDFYEKKGHEFVDVDVQLYDETDDHCLATVSLRAIYRLRGL